MRSALHPRFARPAAASLLLALLFGLGCGASGLEKRRKGYEAFYSGDLPGALEKLEKADRKKDRLLSALDRGVVLHTEGRAAESNEAFARAEEIVAETAVTDITDVAVSFLINDYSIEYKGEDFEKVLVHPFKALNYLALGEPSEALVECRALNNKLVEIQEKYETKSVYAEDAFARYLSGIIYESRGETGSALVDYRLAESAFEKHGEAYGVPFPASLREGLVRLAEEERQADLAARYREKWPDAGGAPYGERREGGEIVLVLENGPAPVKEEQRFDVVVDEEIYSIAFPVYRAVPSMAAYGVLRAAGASAPTELASDVSAIAIKDLEDRYHRVVAKAVVRLAAKHAEVATLKKENTILGHLLNFVNTLNERADLRSWETLPGGFQIARLALPPGVRTEIELDLFSAGGDRLETVPLGPCELGPGETRFLWYRTLE